MSDDPNHSAYLSIPGGKEVLDWFGRIPTFHDAEVIEISLKRKETSSLTLHSWKWTDLDDNGYGTVRDHVVIVFSFDEIVAMELFDFNHQNVIDRLSLFQSMTENDGTFLELKMEPCFGLSGFLRARKVSVSYSVGPP